MKLTNKTLSRLSEEGITKEMIESTTSFSPVKLVDQKEPANLVKCSSGYWVSIKGEFLKDDQNNLLVISHLEAKIARARYELNFKDEIKEKMVLKEMELLKDKTAKYADTYLHRIKLILQLAGIINDSDLGFVLQKRIWEENGILEDKIREAKEIAMQDDYIYSYRTLKELYNKEDYDSLYMYFFQDGLPEIASFSINDNVIKDYFDIKNIDKTIELIKNNSHLYNVALFNIEKRLAKKFNNK